MIDRSAPQSHRFKIAALLFLAVFVAHYLCPVITSLDSRWTVHTAMSILREGNVDLDEYGDLLAEQDDYAIEEVGGRKYGLFPLGTPLLVTPFVYAIDRGLDLALAVVPGWKHSPAARNKAAMGDRFVVVRYRKVEHFLACLVSALTSALVFALAGRYVNRRSAMLLALVFAFCTSAWSVSSRALWQHGPSMLMLTLGLYLIVKAREKPFLVQFAGLPLAYAWIVRPLNAISLVVLGIYVLVRFRRRFPLFLLWTLLVVVPYLIHNLAVYDALWPPYYRPGRLWLHGRFLEALAGNLFSPARGLFIFSPVLLFSACGVSRLWKARRLDGLDASLLIVVLLHWIAISSFPHWWGGGSYGPRFFSDMIPYLVYFMIPLFPCPAGSGGIKGVMGAALFIVLAAASGFTHGAGALSHEAQAWNSRPVSVDDDPSRLWNFKDPPFLRGLR